MRYLKGAAVAFALLAAMLVTSCTTLATSVQSGGPEAGSAYVLASLVKEEANHDGYLRIAGPRGYNLAFTAEDQVQLFAVEPGSYRIVAVEIQNTTIDLSDNARFAEPIQVRAGEITYIGDWLSYYESTIRQVGVRRVNNYSTRDFEEMERRYAEFASAGRSSYFTNDDNFDLDSFEDGEAAFRSEAFVETVYNVPPFFQAYATMSVLADLGLLEETTTAQQVEMMRRFFSGLPETPEEAYTVSEIALGGYRTDGTPLVARLRVAPLNDSFEREGAAYVVVVATNVAVNRETGQPTREPAINLFGSTMGAYNDAFVLFENGRLVSSAVFDESENLDEAIRAARRDPRLAVNVADTLVRDGVAENDDLAAELLNPVIDDSGAAPAVHATALLNMLMYEVLQGNYDQADRLLNELRSTHSSIDEPSFQAVIDVQAPLVIELARAAAE
ncbi:MAG: hypothetical protein ACOCZB_07335 [Spirochaetota bacterium]